MNFSFKSIVESLKTPVPWVTPEEPTLGNGSACLWSCVLSQLVKTYCQALDLPVWHDSLRMQDLGSLPVGGGGARQGAKGLPGGRPGYVI